MGSSRSQMSSAETPTSKGLSQETPRKVKLNKQLKQLHDGNRLFKKEIQEKQDTLHLKVQHFKSLCDQYLTPELSKFVKVQVEQMDRKMQGRRYTQEFKKSSFHRNKWKSFSLFRSEN
ncbi:hypothetical protein Zmor_015051 [Zophobas morio]|uniref:Uncharacterized protein n=1 Tax=Zophobas morio TaxID=2755281 RepID=A0AA38MHJ4_9CUCU|nr:hypothetical protein Zmor_015051 [Zophobas morio]